MPDYQPIPKEAHLARGYCCKHGCYHCPWRVPVDRPPPTVDPRIEAALKSGEPTIIYSDRSALVRSATLQNVTIIYKQYKDE